MSNHLEPLPVHVLTGGARPLAVGGAVAAGLVAVVLALSACSPEVTTTPEPDGVTTGGSSTSTPPTSPPSMPPTTSGGEVLPADQVVWQVDTGGGFVPYAFVANDVPEVTIYGDGRVFLALAQRATDAPVGPVPPPAQMVTGEIASNDLSDFLDEVAASGAIGDGVDYGTPQITDMPGTTVRFAPSGRTSEVNVYALGEGFDDGLTGSQQRARRTLAGLIERSRRLAGDTSPWVPERVEAIDIEPQATPDPGGATTDWPGPAFIDLFGTINPGNPAVGPRCAEVTGDSAAQVFDAALDAGVPFVDSKGDVRQVVVAALLPGEEPCADI
ncbi:MAG: hypothetical protein R2754_09005 [Microthrixaceae bacterium]